MLNAVIIYIWHCKRNKHTLLHTELGSGDRKSGYNSFNCQKRGENLIF